MSTKKERLERFMARRNKRGQQFRAIVQGEATFSTDVPGASGTASNEKNQITISAAAQDECGF